MTNTSPKAKRVMKAWAICLEGDGFIPSFNIGERMQNVLQIHDNEKSAQQVSKQIGGGWPVVELTITYHLPRKKRGGKAI